MADDSACVRSQLGRLMPPYPSQYCANIDCELELTDLTAVFLFTDLQTTKLVVLCEDCSMYVELHRRDRFALVAL